MNSSFMFTYRNIRREEIVGQLRGFLASYSYGEDEEFDRQEALIEKFISDWEGI